MTKFKVGDKVICIKDYTHFTQGKVYKIQNIVGKIITLLDNDIEQNDWYVEDFNKYFEIVPTKNQRITALENEVADLRPLKQEVAELKLIVHELREKKSVEPSTTNTVEEIIEFEGQQYRKVDREAHEGDVVISSSKTTCFVEKGKPYKVTRYNGFLTLNEGTPGIVNLYNGSRTPETVDVYELIKEGLNPQVPMIDETVELTPNQQRAEIIEKAKKFVEDNKMEITGEALYGKYKGEVQTWRNIYVFANKSGKHACNVEFVVDAEKRTITALMRGVDTNNLYEEATAKCNPSDVFNEHIGKAIALGRALGLDVSEFEQAVQPNEVVPGHIIVWNESPDEPHEVVTKNGDWFDFIYLKDNKRYNNHEYCEIEEFTTIINDTNAIYEVIK